jgi:hypothetical protein
MKDKVHQQSGTVYQVRVNGSAVAHWSSVDHSLLDEFANVCAQNPDEYVDIVSVRTEILMSQNTYSQMQRHFRKA